MSEPARLEKVVKMHKLKQHLLQQKKEGSHEKTTATANSSRKIGFETPPSSVHFLNRHPTFVCPRNTYRRFGLKSKTRCIRRHYEILFQVFQGTNLKKKSYQMIRNPSRCMCVYPAQLMCKIRKGTGGAVWPLRVATPGSCVYRRAATIAFQRSKKL